MSTDNKNETRNTAPVHPIVIRTPKRGRKYGLWAAGYSLAAALLEVNIPNELAPEADGHCMKNHWERKRNKSLPKIDLTKPELPWYG